MRSYKKSLVGKDPLDPLQYSCLEVHGQRSLVAKNLTRTEQLSICLLVLDYLMGSMYIITKITKGDRRLSVRLMQHQKDQPNPSLALKMERGLSVKEWGGL